MDFQLATKVFTYFQPFMCCGILFRQRATTVICKTTENVPEKENEPKLCGSLIVTIVMVPSKNDQRPMQHDRFQHKAHCF